MEPGMGLGIIWIVTILISIVSFVLWLWALIDILKSDFNGSEKIIWLLVVFFLPLLGFILYFFIGRKQKIKKDL